MQREALSSVGAEATIYHMFGWQLSEPHWDVSPSGSREYTISPQARDYDKFVLFVNDARVSSSLSERKLRGLPLDDIPHDLSITCSTCDWIHHTACENDLLLPLSGPFRHFNCPLSG